MSARAPARPVAEGPGTRSDGTGEPGLAGYVHPRYAESLADFGVARRLPRSGGWILERGIPASPLRDAMGCYPLFACRDWGALAEDLAELEGNLVSLCAVADPLGEYRLADLRRAFPDLVTPFKDHFVADLRNPSRRPAEHHVRNARKALRRLDVARCEEPAHFLEVWTELYADLVRRHRIRGIAAFSRAAFEKQLRVPGLVAFRARSPDGVVGMVLWYVQEDRAYYHLGSYSASGYRQGASFALFWRSIEYFADSGVHELLLGGGAGLRDEPGDGLARFKRGWATGVRPAYLCGRILTPAGYRLLSRGAEESGYFPAYRRGEFG